MTKNEILEYFKDINFVYNDSTKHDTLSNMLDEVIKEQEPKRVVITTNSYGTKFYHCPRCNHDLYSYPRPIYCSQCGQAVKWE